MISTVAIAYSGRGRTVDGIRDHSERLASQLRQSFPALRVEYLDLREEGNRLPVRVVAAIRTLRGIDDHSALILQYNPFSFARWGFAPWLPLAMAAAKVRRHSFVAVMVHEPYVPMTSFRWALLGSWQRLQLAAVRACCDVTFTSIGAWREMLGRSLPRGPVHHLPVGSNFPDRRQSRWAVRRELGVAEGELVVSVMGRDHPSWMGSYVIAAANAIAAAGAPVCLLGIGATAPPLPGLDPKIRFERPGMLKAGDVAGRLAASDLFLAPLIDGISTRRGSVMAGLQHGLPVVGTSGPLTDQVLADAGEALVLTPVGQLQEFAAAAARLAQETQARQRMGVAARRLYESEFDWPVIADRLLSVLTDGQ
jgi:glycosyltransferase involved in cell wall biosynthesis